MTTEAQRAAAVEYNRAVLQEQRPDIDLSVGGPIDSLLVDGTAVLTAQLQSDAERTYKQAQLKAIADGEVEVPEEDLDQLLAGYFLTRVQASPASGFVTVVVSTNILRTFTTNDTFQSGGLIFRLARAVTVYPAGTLGIDTTSGANVLTQQVYDQETGALFRFVLPLVSDEQAPEAALTAGTRLTPVQGIPGSDYVEALGDFTGGTVTETNQQFAGRALDGLTAKVVAGSVGTGALLRQTYPSADVSSIGAGNPLMTRDRNNPFGVSTGGRQDTYVKVGPVSRAAFTVDAVVTDPVLRLATITLTREQSAGTYRHTVDAAFTAAPPSIVAGALTLLSVSYIPWTGDPEFQPELSLQPDMAWSARSLVQLLVEDTRETIDGYVVAMPGVGDGITGAYQVGTELQSNLLDIDGILTSTRYRPAGLDVLVKAAAPCFVSLTVNATRPNDYNGPTAARISAQLATLITNLPIRTPFLDRLLIAGLIRQISDQLTLTSIQISGLIYGQAGGNISLAVSSDRLTLPTNVVQKVSPLNTYFTANSSSVTVNLV